MLLLGVVLLVLLIGCGGAGRASEAEPGMPRGGLSWSPSPPSVSVGDLSPGHWQQYVQLPSSRSVCPPRVALPVEQALASIATPGAVACAGRGQTLVTGSARLILDFGREMSGPLELRFASGSAGSVSVAYSESLEYLGSDCDQLGIEGIALPAGVRLPSCPRSIALAGGAEDWTDHDPRSGYRYVLLTFAPKAGARIALGAARVAYAALPAQRDLAVRAAYRGWFLSSENDLNRYWYDGAYTAQVDTVAAGHAGLFYEGLPGLDADESVMVDGAKRDRYVWYDLAGPKTLIPMLYGDYSTPRDTLLALGERQSAQGVIPACRTPGTFYGAPCETSWTDATGWWVIALGEYLLWSGDTGFARSQYPRVQRALAALAACGTSGGLISACHGALTYDGGGQLEPTAYLNAVYYQALRTGARIAATTGEVAAAASYERRASVLAATINRRLWDAAAGAYRCSTVEAGCHSQDANVLPVLWGIADPARASRALSYVRRHLWTRYGTRTGSSGTNLSTPVGDLVADWISYFELQARAQRNETGAVMSMLAASWRYMNIEWKPIAGPQGNSEEPPSSTDWEHVIASDGAMFRGPQSSLSHVWSAGATIVETTDLLGLIPTASGFSNWALRPRAAGSTLRWVEGQIPTPHGAIRCRWRIAGSPGDPSGLTLEVSAPAGTSGEVYVPLFGRARMVTEDGHAMGDGAPSTEYRAVSHVSGHHVFRWEGLATGG